MTNNIRIEDTFGLGWKHAVHLGSTRRNACILLLAMNDFSTIITRRLVLLNHSDKILLQLLFGALVALRLVNNGGARTGTCHLLTAASSRLRGCSRHQLLLLGITAHLHLSNDLIHLGGCLGTLRGLHHDGMRLLANITAQVCGRYTIP